MAYVVYDNLTSPNEVLEKMSEYIISRGYQVVEPLKDDTDIYKRDEVDGKKFVFMDRTQSYFIHLRSANGYNIFGVADDAIMDTKGADDAVTGNIGDPLYKEHYNFYGIGATVSEGYSKKQRWYNQYLVPLKFKTKEVMFTWMPVPPRPENLDALPDYKKRLTDGEAFERHTFKDYLFKNKYSLYCNNILKPSDTLIFTVVAENVGGDVRIGHDYRCVHMVFGNLHKYDTWEGGMFFSGSSVWGLTKSAGNIYLPPKIEETILNEDGTERKYYEEMLIVDDSGILPVLSSGSISNTFLRINIDEAPANERGNIYWASSGTDNATGKPMSLPIRNDGGNGEIPHYKNLQSADRLDWGRNINTLNCITLNMPIFMAVRVDPDVLNNYAGAGQVAGVFFVCNLNMQSAGTYEMSYPKSGDLCQIFSPSMRRGRWGYDAISIRQNEDDSDSFTGDITTDTSRTFGI